jgi:uncharacterized oxidoreductase
MAFIHICAMPLIPLIEQTIEAPVEIARPMRNNPGPNEGAFVTPFNNLFAAG